MEALTSNKKDVFLNFIISLTPDINYPGLLLIKRSEIERARLDFWGAQRIVLQMEEMNMLEIKKFDNFKIIISPNGKLDDFYNHGGFVAQEAFLKDSLEKLKLEIDNLIIGNISVPISYLSNLLNCLKSISALLGLL